MVKVENMPAESEGHTSQPTPSSTGSKQRNAGYNEHGCEHYRRRCKLVAPCCSTVYWCRHCHNEAVASLPDPHQRHELDRSAVREVECALCGTRQPLAMECANCGVAFGEYACLRCSFFDDDTSKKQFHCDGCGICRTGGAENFFHCATCGCCYSNPLKGSHICVENSMRHNCPICFEYLFDSTKPTAVLRCGHTLHEDCLTDMHSSGRMNCPTCLKSVADFGAVWRSIDDEIRHTPMPPDYDGWQAEICCHEGCPDAIVPFHAIALKCPTCNGYNTRSLRLIKPPTAQDGEHGQGSDSDIDAPTEAPNMLD